VQTGASASATIGSTLTGTAGLTISGSGGVALTGTNSVTGVNAVQTHHDQFRQRRRCLLPDVQRCDHGLDCLERPG